MNTLKKHLLHSIMFYVLCLKLSGVSLQHLKKINLNNTNLPIASQTRFLGPKIDDYLSWSEHSDTTIKK